MRKRACPLRSPVPDQPWVRAMRKGRYRNARANQARQLYAAGLCINEIVEAMQWQKNQVLVALRRIP